ncbi:hypothetical protein GOP47_0014345 [Adiantum capillus-veneris]|uniref:tripeptidyl-peptidase II n=1 Tax=Adiantum capillus-veneris TaxID=13818 RepID=A0A9D4UM46_ADICA|nr:hypothetical protein GOP47_0014345 [Adiantum capillus-veneris]
MLPFSPACFCSLHPQVQQRSGPLLHDTLPSHGGLFPQLVRGRQSKSSSRSRAGSSRGGRSLSSSSPSSVARAMASNAACNERFLASHPDYDGRGIIIAIFDSGVDPAATGLQTTSDGKPKILDILDCTGSGDVDVSSVVKADKDGFIKGASGGILQVNLAWVNPSGEWHVGYKLAYELFTETLVSRLKLDRKKTWEKHHKEAMTVVLRKMLEFDLKYPKPTDASLKREREDLQNQLELLQKMNDNYDDKGPVIDAVVWNDGNVWRVALDTQELDNASGSGKLVEFTPMTNYRLERKYGIFSSIDACSFVTNVYDNGNILSIVTDCSPHGTHVAGITAAYHAEEPLFCGVAPGAQLISCKIGDSRLGSMETGTGLTRALIAAIENKCHLINMSYGEPTSTPDYGRFVELANEAVNKHGIIFVSSAGNAGPSLNTVGAPGGTSSSIIGIGAYVSPAMAVSAHSIVEPPIEGLQYTWSSRGPTADGDVGVCLSAPGAAIAPVPQWTLQCRMLMNGTSMSSPCACGGIALVLSALKAEGQSISPWVVRKALENTAMPTSNNTEDILTAGFGLLQVDSTYQYLQKSLGRPAVFYQVQLNRSGITGTGQSYRGVYLREAVDCCTSTEWSVQVKPKFHEDANKIEVVVPFEESIKLESKDPAWVKCPDYLLLTHNGRAFNVVVDPSQLAPGVHCSEICGIDCEAPWRGPIFRIPVTILKPLELTNQPPSVLFKGMNFVPGHIERRFIVVPIGATWAEATMRVSGFDTPRRFYLNAVQLAQQKRPVVSESTFVLPGPSTKDFSFRVQGGITMELTVAQFWSSGIGSHLPATATVEIQFHGLLPCKDEVLLDGSDIASRIDVTSFVGLQSISPRATLNTIRCPYRPVESKLQALPSDRDKLPNGHQILSLILTYKFNLAEACKVTPRLPALNKRMYDNEFESQFYMIADVNKRVLAMGDVYPKGVKLSKGDYTLRLHLRHDNIQYLEKLKKAVIFIDKSLEEKNFIRLSFFSCIDGGITGSFAFKPRSLLSGESTAFYIASPAEDKLPKDSQIGTSLLGKITYGRIQLHSTKDEKNGQVCPASYPLTCIVPPTAKNEEKQKEKDTGKKTLAQSFEEQVRDAKIKALSNLSRGTPEERKEWNDLASALKLEFPKNLKLLHEVLIKVSATQKKEDGKDAINEVIDAADQVIDVIDKEALAKFFGMKSVAEEPEAMKIDQEMEKQHDALVDALYKKGLALAELEDDSIVELVTGEDLKGGESTEERTESPNSTDISIQGGTQGLSAASDDSFEETYLELRKWIDISSTRYSLLKVIHEKRAGRFGTALKVLNELLQDDGKAPKRSLYELQVYLLENIGWGHWAVLARKMLLVYFPSNYPLF